MSNNKKLKNIHGEKEQYNVRAQSIDIIMIVINVETHQHLMYCQLQTKHIVWIVIIRLSTFF